MMSEKFNLDDEATIFVSSYGLRVRLDNSKKKGYGSFFRFCNTAL